MLKRTVPWVVPTVLYLYSSAPAWTQGESGLVQRLPPGARILLHRSRFEGVTILPTGMQIGWTGDRVRDFRTAIDLSTQRPESVLSVTEDLDREIRATFLKHPATPQDEEKLIELREQASRMATCADAERQPSVGAFSTLDGYRETFVDCRDAGRAWLARLNAVKARFLGRDRLTPELEGLFFRVMKFHRTHFVEGKFEAMRQRCAVMFRVPPARKDGKLVTLPFEGETRELRISSVRRESGGVSRLTIQGDAQVKEIVCHQVASIAELYELFETPVALAQAPTEPPRKVAETP